VIAAKRTIPPTNRRGNADLVYHLLVTLVARGVSLEEIAEELRKRQKTGKRS
jgi:phosphoribosyl-ATP pyrophosphohydrolase